MTNELSRLPFTDVNSTLNNVFYINKEVLDFIHLEEVLSTLNTGIEMESSSKQQESIGWKFENGELHSTMILCNNGMNDR